jgi:hypothetical protein
MGEVSVSISIAVPESPRLEEILRAELPEVSVERREGKVFLLLKQEEDESWSLLRSKVNSALRIAETVKHTMKAAGDNNHG